MLHRRRTGLNQFRFLMRSHTEFSDAALSRNPEYLPILDHSHIHQPEIYEMHQLLVDVVVREDLLVAHNLSL